MAAIDRCNNIADVRRLAARRAHPMVFGYIDGGADDEVTLGRNSSDFDAITLTHRVLEDVSSIDTRTTVFGEEMALPFFFSPSAGNRLFHTEGEAAVAQVARELGIAYCLSTLSTVSIEDVAKIGPSPRWFQLYVWKDRGLVREMIARARASGYSALILTADFPITGNRERDIRTGFTIPPRTGPRQALGAIMHPAWTWDYLTSAAISYANLDATVSATSLSEFVAKQLSPDFTWRDAEWLLGEWNGTAILKGVVHPDDARRAIDLGFRGIMVSNHGGRQLDGVHSPISALPAILDATSGDADVVVDGGIRRGTHMMKAIALGAKAVSFARPYLFGLAAGGTAGVRRAGTILASELRRDMALAGVNTIDAIDGRLFLKGRDQRLPL
ncbi:alpha-hydroxy acid oxidase [Sphingobium algorifonticola]|uniref:Alpha-hydroxy-acid oxidizing protein n=1 Tax=Sphingobium algorifonticola TaxID=2008318 RepID=A0A437J4A5_9SPHN|nr:alpha-hydroxy acid oxidase [Sphingobium algorifonticola]RVT39428.1 alpha-hydroxy-acid oxidizing protein [Sphingobium algorifonticola]